MKAHLTKHCISRPAHSDCKRTPSRARALGLKPDDALPFDPASFPLSKAAAAYDMIYRPAETPFLRAAKAAGCQTANGIGMLLYQGARALELWSGREAPVAMMRDALVANVYGK